MGIATKISPSMDNAAFMSDKDLVSNKQIIDGDIAKIKATGKVVVMPKDGFGTGLAKLKEKAPQTYAYLKQRLLEEFGFDNDTGSVKKIIIQTPLEGLNERLDSYGNTKLILPSNFYEGARPEGRLNAFKAIIDKVQDNFQILADVKWNEFTFIEEEDLKKLDEIRPKVKEFSKLNLTEITRNRTVAVEKRYAQLSNEILNEFVDVIGKHVEQQLGKTIETSNPIGISKKEWDALSQEEKNKIKEC